MGIDLEGGAVAVDFVVDVFQVKGRVFREVVLPRDRKRERAPKHIVNLLFVEASELRMMIYGNRG